MTDHTTKPPPQTSPQPTPPHRFVPFHPGKFVFHFSPVLKGPYVSFFFFFFANNPPMSPLFFWTPRPPPSFYVLLQKSFWALPPCFCSAPGPLPSFPTTSPLLLLFSPFGSECLFPNFLVRLRPTFLRVSFAHAPSLLSSLYDRKPNPPVTQPCLCNSLLFSPPFAPSGYSFLRSQAVAEKRRVFFPPLVHSLLF